MVPDENTIPDRKGQQTPPFTMLKAMVGIGAICGLLIVFAYEFSLPRIEQLKEIALQEAIGNVIPGLHHAKRFEWKKDGTFVLLDGKTSNPIIHAGYNSEGKLIGFAVEGRGQGYADFIKLLYGYEPYQEEIIGLYVLESKETPGLGDKIQKDERFVANFKSLDVSLKADRSGPIHPLEVVKSGEKKNPWQIDGITGATISSRAVGNILLLSSETILPAIQANLHVFQE